jgi:hypothetical protein
VAARELGVDVSLGGFSLSGVFSLSGLVQAFDDLVSRNDERRVAELDPPALVVRVRCPHCGAPAFQLTRVERDGGLERACRSCRSFFPLGV